MSLLLDSPPALADAFADMHIGVTWGMPAEEDSDVLDDDGGDTLTPQAAVAALGTVERQLARLHALQARLLVAAADTRPHVAEYTVLLPGDRPEEAQERVIRIQDAMREEIASALRWSPVTAQYRIDAARLLVGPLADTASALASGDITPAHARILVESAETLPGRWMRDQQEEAEFAAACTALQARVLPVAARGTLSRTRTAAVRAVLAIDPEGAGRRRASAQRTKDVTLSDDVDGISGLHARLASEHAHAIMQRVARHADSLPEVHATDASVRESAGQRRARALVDLLLGATMQNAPGNGDAASRAASRMHAQVDVLIELPTLLALRAVLDDGVDVCEGTACAPQGDLAVVTAEHVALLAQRTAVHPQVVRDLLADPDVAMTLRRLVTDPLTGALLDLGRTTYAIPDRLRDFLVARDRSCRFPGCRQPASRCQVDHVVAWDAGGATDPANLHLLCPRHHQLKTHGGWIPSRQPDGTTSWQSPQGREFSVPSDWSRPSHSPPASPGTVDP